MSKKKEELKEKIEDGFDIEKEFEKINIYLRDGFKKFLYETKEDGVKTKKEFDKLLKEYGG